MAVILKPSDGPLTIFDSNNEQSILSFDAPMACAAMITVFAANWTDVASLILRRAHLLLYKFRCIETR